MGKRRTRNDHCFYRFHPVHVSIYLQSNDMYHLPPGTCGRIKQSVSCCSLDAGLSTPIRAARASEPCKIEPPSSHLHANLLPSFLTFFLPSFPFSSTADSFSHIAILSHANHGISSLRIPSSRWTHFTRLLIRNPQPDLLCPRNNLRPRRRYSTLSTRFRPLLRQTGFYPLCLIHKVNQKEPPIPPRQLDQDHQEFTSPKSLVLSLLCLRYLLDALLHL